MLPFASAAARGVVNIASRVLPCSFLRGAIDDGFVAPFYHLISDYPVCHVGSTYPFRDVRTFRAELDFLLKQFRPIALPELLAGIAGDHPLPRNTFFLSFDDGLREMYEIVAPVLLKKGVPATFFVVTRFLDNQTLFYRSKALLVADACATVRDRRTLAAADDILVEAGIHGKPLCDRIRQVTYDKQAVLDRLAPLFGLDFEEFLARCRPYLDSWQVQELIDRGFTIGAHSEDHPYYPSVSFEERVRQTQRSMEFVSTRFKVPYNAFALPFGVSGQPLQPFLDAVFATGTVDVMFGTSAGRRAEHPRYVQRLWMEASNGSVRERVFGEYVVQKLRSFRDKT